MAERTCREPPSRVRHRAPRTDEILWSSKNEAAFENRAIYWYFASWKSLDTMVKPSQPVAHAPSPSPRESPGRANSFCYSPWVRAVKQSDDGALEAGTRPRKRPRSRTT